VGRDANENAATGARVANQFPDLEGNGSCHKSLT
jgi:hypothetical protein